MSIFNNKRLTNRTFKLDIDRMRQGWYSDKYFVNIAQTLQVLSSNDYRFAGNSAILNRLGIDPSGLATGDIEVEMQFFNRRHPRALIAGVDKALSVLRHCTGYPTSDDTFVETDWDTALGVVAGKFAQVKQEHGGDALAVLASAKCTNEENYLFNKFARQVVGTNTIDHCARL